MDFDDFSDWVNDNLEEDEDGLEDLEPMPLTYQSAVDEAWNLIDDFKDEKETTVINIFEFKDGFQVDIISNHQEFELYSHLYDGSQVAAQVRYKGDDKIIVDMK